MTETEHFVNSALRGKWSHHVPMSKHTTWRAGGVADRMYQPADLADLLVFLRSLPADEPVHVVGLGSNLLVRDGGLRGTVLLLHGTLNALRIEPAAGAPLHGGGTSCAAAADEKMWQTGSGQWLSEIDTMTPTTLYVEAGVPGAKLARFAAKHNLHGAEFFAGIPGTVGGMLAMNAGCYGSEIWEKVERVLVVDRSGVLHERTPQDYEIGYRSVKRIQDAECGIRGSACVSREKGAVPESRIPHPASFEMFAGAWMKFEPGYSDIARQEIKEMLKKRIASQPLNFPNAGSVFSNPPGNYAAVLIQQCGLKGKRIGGAQVSEKHANFIVNTGGASASDIENLIDEVRATVAAQTGVKLHLEVKIIGEPGARD